MSYDGSEAYFIDEGAREYAQGVGRGLEAVEGGHLDEEARRGVSALTSRAVASIVALVIALFVMGGISVALTSGTVALLQTGETLTAQIKEMRADNNELRIERSLLTRADRISRIATQNLHMVYASDAKTLDLT